MPLSHCISGTVQAMLKTIRLLCITVSAGRSRPVKNGQKRCGGKDPDHLYCHLYKGVSMVVSTGVRNASF